MNIVPEGVNVKQCVWSALIGAVIFSIIGFKVWGWTFHGAALQQADTAVETALTENNAAICVAQAQTILPTIRAELEPMSAWKRIGYIQEQPWAHFPGQETGTVTREVAAACMEKILTKS